MRLSSFITLLLCTLISFGSKAGNVDKAYKALAQFDYFRAKKYFTKALKYNESPGAQGLAIIYYRNDNPFHSYDSAYVYVIRSIEEFDMTKKRKQEKWGPFGFTKDSLYALRQEISTKFYERAKKEHTIAAYTTFINAHPWAEERNNAIHLRDSLAFFESVNSNTSSSYKSFMEIYPESEYFALAEQNYFDVQYQEITDDGSLESYMSFIESNPSSPLIPEAELNVYELATEANTPEAFKDFIANYPQNRHVNDSWKSWYQLSLSAYSEEVCDYFLENTNTPYAKEIEKDKELFDKTLLPCILNDAYGFMNDTGAVVIDAKYQFSSFFQEGLAIVAQGGKYGFVNKRGELQIPCQFDAASDFVNGLAIVELNERYGMIDRNGRYVFDCIYDELGLLSEGLSYAMVADMYGYYNIKGEMIIPHLFEDAYDFKNGEAKVIQEGKEGVINLKGEFVLPAVHETILKYQDTMFVFSDDGLYGIMNDKSQIFVEPMYNSINPVNNGLSVAALGDRMVYLDSVGDIVLDNGYSVYPNYQSKAEFTDGVAIVMKKEKYGRIDTAGNVITDFKFDNLGVGKHCFSGKKKDAWGLYDYDGKELVAPTYDGLLRAQNGSFIAVQNDSLGVIDHEGNVLVPIVFSEVEYIKDDLFLVRMGDKSGIYRNEKLIIPVRFEQIGIFNPEFLFLSIEGQLSYFNIKKEELVEAKE